MTQNQKDETYFKICNAVLRLQIEKGHLKWKVSNIADYSGVTRSLIYYYFGKEKETIYEEAIRFMIDFFLPNIDDTSIGVKERMRDVIINAKEMPYLFMLFYLEKDRDTTIGGLIRDAEDKIVKRIADQYKLDKDEALKIYLIELGSVAYKRLNINDVDRIFSKFK